MSRPFPTHTELGKRTLQAGFTKSELAAFSGVHERTLTEYLAGRKEMLPRHRRLLAKALGVTPNKI